MKVRILTWSEHDQPDVQAIADAVLEITRGAVVMEEMETGRAGTYTWVISDKKLTGEQKRRLRHGKGTS